MNKTIEELYADRALLIRELQHAHHALEFVSKRFPEDPRMMKYPNHIADILAVMGAATLPP